MAWQQKRVDGTVSRGEAAPQETGERPWPAFGDFGRCRIPPTRGLLWTLRHGLAPASYMVGVRITGIHLGLVVAGILVAILGEGWAVVFGYCLAGLARPASCLPLP